MSAFVTAAGGFLLAVIWFDLMFDVQVLRHRGRDLPEGALSSIAAYYRRVTADARPMTWLIAAMMLATIVAICVQIADGDAPRWAAWASLALAGSPILLAGVHTFPSAVRLATRAESAAVQSRLARSICRDHLLSVAAIASLLTIQLAFA